MMPIGISWFDNYNNIFIKPIHMKFETRNYSNLLGSNIKRILNKTQYQDDINCRIRLWNKEPKINTTRTNTTNTPTRHNRITPPKDHPTNTTTITKKKDILKFNLNRLC